MIAQKSERPPSRVAFQAQPENVEPKESYCNDTESQAPKFDQSSRELRVSDFGQLLNGEELGLVTGQLPRDVERLDALAIECARGHLAVSARRLVRSLLLMSAVDAAGERTVFPSPAPLARGLTVSEETVRRSLRTLERRGILLETGHVWVTYETSAGPRRALIKCYLINFDWKATVEEGAQGDFFDLEWRRVGLQSRDTLRAASLSKALAREQVAAATRQAAPEIEPKPSLSSAPPVTSATRSAAAGPGAESVPLVKQNAPLNAAQLQKRYGLTDDQVLTLRSSATARGHDLDQVLRSLAANSRSRYFQGSVYVSPPDIIAYLVKCFERDTSHYAPRATAPQSARSTTQSHQKKQISDADVRHCHELTLTMPNGVQWVVDASGAVPWLNRIEHGLTSCCPVEHTDFLALIRHAVVTTTPEHWTSEQLAGLNRLTALAASSENA